MKSFACGDVVPGCQARWLRSNDDEILAAVAEHAAIDHGLTEIPDELVQAVRSRIAFAGA
jgi:predicted small metal-binding protein